MHENFLNMREGIFSLLVNYAQAETAELKSIFLDKIFECRGRNRKVIEVESHDEFLANVVLPRLQVLLSFEDIDRSVAGLAKLLKSSAEQTSKYLKQLEDLGLARYSEVQQLWNPVQESFYVPKRYGSQVLRNYHDQCLIEAMKAQDLPAESRRYRSTMLPLTEEDFLTILEEFQGFLHKSLAKYDKKNLGVARLYKMNFNLFPLTEERLSSKLSTKTSLVEVLTAAQR